MSSSSDEVTPPWELFSSSQPEPDQAPDFSSYGKPVGDLDFSGLKRVEPEAAQPQRSRFAWDPDVEDALETAAREHGVDRSMLDAFARIESGGRPRVQTGSYKGLFQLSDTEFRKHGGQTDPFDPYENARAGAAKIRAESAAFAKTYGRDPTAAELYLIHQQGVGGAAAHWSNPDAPAWQNMASTLEGRQRGASWARKAIWGNIPDTEKRRFGNVDNVTSRDFTKLWEDKVARFGGASSSAAFPVASGPAAIAPAAKRSLGAMDPNIVASAQPGQRMALGGPLSTSDDDEPDDQFLLDQEDDDEQDDAPAYLGGPKEDLIDDNDPAGDAPPDFSKLGKPVGQVPPWELFKDGGKPDFSKFGKPVNAKPSQPDNVGSGFWENVGNGQQYRELAKGVIPGAISMQGTALQGVDAVGARAQYGARDFGAKQLEIMDRVDRGDAVSETDDAMGYQHMGPEDRAKARADLVAAQAAFNPTPMQDRTLYKAGEAVQEYAKGLMPAAPGYEKSLGRQLGEGLGSMAGGMPYGLFGSAPAALFFGASGAGEAAQRAVEFDKKERKEGRPGLTQEQITLAGIAGVAPGTTDLLPLETLLGRLPLPVPPGARGALAQAIGRIGGQAFVEGLQEGGQQFLQNLIAREVYNPSQDLGEEVLGNTGIGAGVGGLAQTGKEVGSGLVHLASGRRARRSGSAQDAPADDQSPEAPLPAPASPASAERPPVASTDELGWLRARGFDDDAIAEMSPGERAAEIEEAKASGVRPVPAKLAPDNPTAEPLVDLVAQARDLADPDHDRSGLYIPLSGLKALPDANVEKLSELIDGRTFLENFDNRGGLLVVNDEETAQQALAAKARGEPLQTIIGRVTGAGSGKPADGSIVVQQRTRDGGVARETLTTQANLARVKADFAAPGRTVVTLTPQEALDRRSSLIEDQGTRNTRGTRAAPMDVHSAEDLAIAGERAEEPTEAQAAVGNYAKGHIRLHGLDISIETPKGGIRRGPGWEAVSPAAYGYIKGVSARSPDGEHVDVYVGADPTSDRVFVVDQADATTKRFDEAKAIFGVRSHAEATRLYDAAFSDGKGPQRRQAIHEMSVEEFRDLLETHDFTKPVGGSPDFSAGAKAATDVSRVLAEAELALSSGERYEIAPAVVEETLNAVAGHTGILPDGTSVGAMESVEAANGLLLSDTDPVRATFRSTDGSTFSIKLSWQTLTSVRAFATTNGARVGFVRFASGAGKGITGQRDAADTRVGELIHEAVHVLRRRGLLTGDRWAALLRHAKSLRLLDGSLASYLEMVGDSSARKATGTIREAYTRLYHNQPDLVERINQEYVAHLAELYSRGRLDGEIPAGIAGILDDLMASQPDATATIKPSRGRSAVPNYAASAQDEDPDGAWQDMASDAYARDLAIERRNTPPASRPRAAAAEKLAKEDQLGRRVDRLMARVRRIEDKGRDARLAPKAIAEQIHAETGVTVEPEQIGSPDAWWRMQSKPGAGRRYSEEERRIFAEGYAAGRGIKEIVAEIAMRSGRRMSSKNVGKLAEAAGIKRNRHADRQALWTRNSNLRLARLDTEGKTVAQIAQALSAEFGKTYTGAAVEDQIRQLRAAYRPAPTSREYAAQWQPEALDLLKALRGSGMSFAAMARQIEEETGQVVSRSAVAGMLDRLRIEEQRTALRADLEQPDFAIGGIKAKGAPLSSRNLAESMERKGKDAEFILKNTGWFRGADQKWRFEIDDSAARIVNVDQKVTTPKAGFWRSITGKRAPGVPAWAGKGVQIGLNIKIPEILSHEKLFHAYPMLRNMRVSIITGPGVPRAHEGGAFIWKEEGGKILYSPIQIKARNKADILPYLMHEIQHYIQRKEGFQGGSASSGRKGDFDTRRLDYNATPSKQMIFGNEQFSTTTFRSQQDAIGYNERPDWRSHIAGMNAAEQTALVIADLWDARDRAPSMGGLISINPETRGFLANKFIEYRDLPRKKADKIDEAAVREHILPALQAELMSQLRVTAEDYLGSLGEAEANAVMDRLNYTPEQRRNMLPKIPKGANAGQVTPDFREAAQAVLDSARKTQAIREKWLMDPVDLGDGVSVQRWRENSLSFSRDEAFDRGAELAAELDFENGRAIVHFMKHALDGFKVGTKAGYAPLTDAEMTFLADKAEAYVRSINLLPTPDIRLKTDRMDIPQERLSDREIAFWKNRDPFFFVADVSKPVPRNVMAWAWSLDDGELSRIIGPELVAHIVEARNVDRAEAEEAAQRVLDATQEALHNEDSVSAAHQSLVEDARMASLLMAADLEELEDFRGLLHLHHQRALNKEASEQSAASPIEMPMPVDYVTAKLDPEQWRIRDRDAHSEPEAVPSGIWDGHKLRNPAGAQAIVYQDSSKVRDVWHGGISGIHVPSLRGTLQTSPPLASMSEAKVWVEKTLAENSIAFEKASGAAASLIGRVGISPKQQATLSRDLTEAVNIVSLIAGREVDVRFQDTINPGVVPDQLAATERAGFTAETALGTYRRPTLNARAVITLALANDDLLTTAGHEAWHHVEEVLANQQEKRLLTSPAEMRRMRAQAAEEIGMDVSDPRFAQIPDFEVRAIAFQKYRREHEEGREPPGVHIGLRRFWRRVIRMLAAAKNALLRHGFTSYEDVFEAARKGEMATRPAQISADADPDAYMASLIPAVIRQQTVAALASITPQSIRNQWARLPNRDEVRRALQDQMIYVKRLEEQKAVQAGSAVPIHLSTYIASRLYPKAGEQQVDNANNFLEPMKDVLRKNGISIEAFGDYLYARHAKERNDAILKIDPTNPAGSGMTNAEAAQILASARPKQAAYDAAAKLIDQMIVETRERLLRAGLIDQATHDTWKNKYRYYVPLRGFESGDERGETPRIGRGFDIRGPEAIQALGRRSKSDNPIFYALLQANQSIVRAEKNRVDKTLYRFIQAYPDPKLYQIYKGEQRRRLNPVTRQVETYWVQPAFARNDNVHGVKIGGKQFYMELKDPNLARAMRGIGGTQTGPVMSAAMKLARLYSSLLTSYNPEFVVSNFFRDIQTALANVTDVAGKPADIRRQILKEAGSLKSMRGVMAALYSHEGRTVFGTKRAADETMIGTKRSQGAQDYARWFEEYRHAGGKISFMEFNDVSSIQRDIERSLKRGRFARIAKQAIQHVDNLNAAVENGVRLSTFIALRKHGVEVDRAAMIARDLTVDFNLKGEMSSQINAMYLFFNASVQGSTRMLRAIASSRSLQIGVASIMGAAFMVDWWNYMVAGDDDDGKNRYDKIRPWIKERNMIIMTGRPDGSYIQIPMPYGYNLFWLGGQQTAAVMRGAAKPHEAAVNIAKSAFEVFSPIGGANGSFLQLLSPTMLDPMVQIVENKTWYGGQIYPQKHNKNQPNSETFTSGVHPWFVDVARSLNRLDVPFLGITGGNMARSGTLDVSPEVLEHLVEFAGGGLGKFMSNVVKSGQRAYDGEEWLPEKTPFVRRLYSKATTESRRSDFWTAWNEVDAAHYEVDNLIKAARKGKSDRDEIQAARERNMVELQAYPMMRDTQKFLAQLRKERMEAQLDGNLSRMERESKIRAITERENVVILRSLNNLNQLRKANERSKVGAQP